jgi:ubiquinone/menaquinone biosynthesis C-methylase UbiE
MPASNPTSRFSGRVENYIRYRPGYPPEVLNALKTECGLKSRHVIADIASGTGIWTRRLLENGNPVFGVEPNAEMREAGERLLAEFPKFTSIAGPAEATTLADQSVDFVTAAQAAHWFDRARSRQEFARILKPGGWLVLLWNERLTDSTPFLRDCTKTCCLPSAPIIRTCVMNARRKSSTNFLIPFRFKSERSRCSRNSTTRVSRAGSYRRPMFLGLSIPNTLRCCENSGLSSTRMPSKGRSSANIKRGSTSAIWSESDFLREP